VNRLFKIFPNLIVYIICGTGVLTLTAPGSAISRQGDVSVESRIDKSQVTVGELVRYEVIVKHEPDIEITMPPPGINLGGFEIRDYKPFDPVKKGGMLERKVEYTIAAYDTGMYVIPPTGVLLIPFKIPY